MEPTKVTCEHTRLHFGSGDYYVICADCHQYWVALKPNHVNDGVPDQGRYGFLMDGKFRVRKDD